MGEALTVPPAAMATEAARLASVDSGRALALAARARDELDEGADPHGAALVERALGVIDVQRGRMPAAVGHLRRAVTLAERRESTLLAAEVRLDLSEALMLHGRPEEAQEETDRARQVLRGANAGRPLVRSALILQRQGRHGEALDASRRALAALRHAGDREWEARLLCNRGVLHAFRGEHAAAEADLERSAALHAALGNALALAGVRHNLGFVAARRGDVPEALARYDAADREYRRLGSDRAILLLDRCEVLLSVHLVREARDAAEQAVGELEASGLDADLAEARLTLAHAAMLDGAPAAGLEQAKRARRAFRRQGRAAWASLARYWELRARWVAEEPAKALLDAARSTSTELHAAGWAAEALDARLIAGRTALALGDRVAAGADLSAAGAARRHGRVQLRVGAWHAEALARVAGGDARGAARAVRAGLRVMDAHRAALGATELRAQASAHGSELAALGVELALGTGRPRKVLDAIERCRTSARDIRAARPPADPALAEALAALRQVAAEMRDAVLEGGGNGHLIRRHQALEEAVRRRAHAVRATAGPAAAVPPVPALAARLGSSVLVEYVESRGRLFAVTLRDGRARLWDLGAGGAAARELPALAFSLRRLALGRGGPAAQEAHARAATAAAARLDAILLGPLAGELGDRPLVVVPTGGLHGVDWPALPSCRSRPLSVAPSAAVWFRCAAPAERSSTVAPLLVAGPGLPDAAAEVRDLCAAAPEARCLTGREATVAAVTAGLADAGLAHVAAHGTFRTDNALFSSLELADGPLTVYDVEALGRAPERLVLSACDSGLTSVAARDALTGFTAALLESGTRTVIGSVVPVRDDQTRALMVALHRRLRRGESPAAALAACRTELAAGTPAGLAAAVAFVCHGAG